MMVTELIKTALQCGEYELKGQFILGSNYTFLVNVHYEGGVYLAVYKPRRGEQPLWDFPENTLAGREVAAYMVSEALGLHIVPFTTLRADGPHGAGSLQQFIEYDPDYHYFNFRDEDGIMRARAPQHGARPAFGRIWPAARCATRQGAQGL